MRQTQARCDGGLHHDVVGGPLASPRRKSPVHRESEQMESYCRYRKCGSPRGCAPCRNSGTTCSERNFSTVACRGMSMTKGAARTRPTRSLKCRGLVVTEGTVTEKQYIETLVQHLRQSSAVVSVTSVGVGKDPVEVVKKCIECRDDANRKKRATTGVSAWSTAMSIRLWQRPRTSLLTRISTFSSRI